MQYKGDLFTITNACCTFQQKCYFCQSYYLYSVLCGDRKLWKILIKLIVLKVPLIKQQLFKLPFRP